MLQLLNDDGPKEDVDIGEITGIAQCEVCSMKFVNEHGLRVHSKIHTPKYQCPHCSEGFQEPIDIILHIRNDHGKDNTPYECIFCDFVSENFDDVSDHLKDKHEKVPNYTCTICKKGFPWRSWFMEHANIHTGEKPYMCEICGMAFPYSRYLAAHKNRLHTDEQNPKVFECLLCKKTYTQRSSFIYHMNLHAGKVIVCDVCGKTFTSNQMLKLHYQIHTGYKPFKCKFCEKAFRTKNLLIAHERIHTGEKPFQCEHCEKCFSQKTTLVIHVRSHTGERPYVCLLCDKAFVSRAILNVHLKSCKGFVA